MTQQLACTYAALILNEVGKTDAASLQAVAKAAGIEVSSGMAAAYANALASANVSDALGNMSFSGGGGAAPAAAAGGAAAAPAAGGAAAAKEEKVEEEEGDDDMGFGLFD